MASASVGAVAEKFTFFFSKASPFSQHHPCEFKIGEIVYNCAEQYMMHQKAVVFKDGKMAEQILKSSNPVEQKRCGRKVTGFDPLVWNRKCEDIVKQANVAKFSQNEELKKQLLKTEGTTLVEASPRDRKWGIGMGKDNPKALDQSTWRGKNLLGFILTRIRDKLLDEKSSESTENVDGTETENMDEEKSADELLDEKSSESTENMDEEKTAD